MLCNVPKYREQPFHLVKVSCVVFLLVMTSACPGEMAPRQQLPRDVGTQLDMLPAQSDMLPARSDMLPARSDMLPAQSDVLTQECGDGLCGPFEECTSCPEDCGACARCEDGSCDQGESCVSCPQDCGSCPSCSDSAPCLSGQDCIDGMCVCNAQSCPNGCCDTSNQCRPGTADDRCGTGGMSCYVCADTPGPCGLRQSCNGSSTCTQNFPQVGVDCGTCRSCDGAGSCMVNSSDHSDCTSGQQCLDGVCAGVSGPQIVSFTLVNANTDQDIGTLRDGDEINIQSIGTNQINIRANTSPEQVGSVKFALDGNSSFRVENGAPYTLAGDVPPDYLPWTPSIGSHTVRATPYSGKDATGTAGTFKEIALSVISGSGGQTSFTEVGGVVSMEAEHYSANTGYVFSNSNTIVTPQNLQLNASGYSGEGYMATNGTGVRMDYEIEFTTTGTYVVNLRSMADFSANGGSEQNGFKAQFDGADVVCSASGCGLNVAKWAKWAWVTKQQWPVEPFLRGCVTIDVNTPGKHTFSILKREKHSWLDKIVLRRTSFCANDSNCQGCLEGTAGPPES